MKEIQGKLTLVLASARFELSGVNCIIIIPGNKLNIACATDGTELTSGLSSSAKQR